MAVHRFREKNAFNKKIESDFAIALWNVLALDQAVTEARQDDVDITDEDLKHVLPTMIEHINFVGQFHLDFNRQLPFKKAVAS